MTKEELDKLIQEGEEQIKENELVIQNPETPSNIKTIFEQLNKANSITLKLLKMYETE